jgi:hypothetical protein
MRYALYFLHGQWVAACSTCGAELARSRSRWLTQRAARSCPACLG